MGHTVLVTGGAGYVGSGLVRELLFRGDRVVCVDQLMFGGESLLDVWNHENFIFRKSDINNHEEIRNVVREFDYGAVIHLAAIVGDPACQANPELSQMTNWVSTKILIDECRKVGIPKFLFASTCSNYGKMPDPTRYMFEESPLAPVSLYAELKVKVENYLFEETDRSPDFCPIGLRFATVYGLSPRMRFDLTINEFTKELVLGRELAVFGEQFWRPYCHVNDFSQAFIKVMAAPTKQVAYEVFNVGDTQENYTKNQLLRELTQQIPDAQIKFVERHEDPRDYRVNCDKIKERLGFMISKRVPDGIREIKEVVSQGIIKNPDDPRYVNFVKN